MAHTARRSWEITEIMVTLGFLQTVALCRHKKPTGSWQNSETCPLAQLWPPSITSFSPRLSAQEAQPLPVMFFAAAKSDLPEDLLFLVLLFYQQQTSPTNQIIFTQEDWRTFRKKSSWKALNLLGPSVQVALHYYILLQSIFLLCLTVVLIFTKYVPFTGWLFLEGGEAISKNASIPDNRQIHC